MNFLDSAYNKLKLDDVYYTPKMIIDNINVQSIIANPPFANIVLDVVYVDYLDCNKNHRQSRKNFKSYEDAWQWVCKNFDNPSKDVINYY